MREGERGTEGRMRRVGESQRERDGTVNEKMRSKRNDTWLSG